MHTKNEVLAEALNLPPIERAQLIEDLLSSFEFPDRERLDLLWAAEADDRVKAFKQGEFEAIPMEEVFAKINRRTNR